MRSALLEKATDPLRLLFWKTQLNILRACPPLCSIVTTGSLGAANSRAVWLKTLLRLSAQAPRALAEHLRNEKQGRSVLSRVTLVVTTYCNLRCDKCIQHIPDFKRHRHFPAQVLAGDLEALFACVDHLYAIVICGGEVFLYRELDQVLQACAASGKIGDISVATNGTIIPDAKTLAALRESKARVNISRYDPALQPDVERLKAVLKENGIPYSHESSTVWHDTGGFERMEDGLERRRYSACATSICNPLLDGQLHLCGKSALMAEGMVPDCPDDYIDLRARPTRAAFREQWRKLLKRRTLSACSYCLGDAYFSPKVPVAVQRPPEKTDD